MDGYILQCNNLTKKYGKSVALDNFSLNLERGKIVGLLGPNGSGKTTLIKLANGLLAPFGGQILIDGKAPGYETKALISYLPDKNHLPLSMKIKDLLALFADFYADFDIEKAKEMISILNIDLNAKLKTLSKGNQEKVQLILVMSRKASLYLLDEPIGGVDPATRDYILNSIVRNYSENSTVLISTHLIADVESVLDDIVFIKEGKLVLHDSVDSVREKEGKSIDQLFREVFRC